MQAQILSGSSLLCNWLLFPQETPHFHWAKSGEYVTQVTAMGPLALEYLSAKDDPRNNNL